MPSISGHWTGVFWGTNSGVANADFVQKGVTFTGVLVLTEPEGVSTAQLEGSVRGSALEAEITAFESTQVVGLAARGKVSGLIAIDYIEGKWSTDRSTSGSFTLLRAPSVPRSEPNAPFALTSKTIELSAYRLDRQQLTDLVNAIHAGTKVPNPAIGVSWNGKTLTKVGLAALLEDGTIPPVIHDLSVAVNEPHLNLGTRQIFFEFEGQGPQYTYDHG